MGGYQAMDYASYLLRLQVAVSGLERLPKQGRVVIICSHPTGLADGVAVYDAFKAVRPDMMFFANSDAHRVNPRLADIFIPVEWVPGKRTRERTRLTLHRSQEAFEAERALAIFPAGAIGLPGADGVVNNPPKQPTTVSLAR